MSHNSAGLCRYFRKLSHILMNHAAIHAQLQRMRKTWMPPFNAHLTYSFFTLAPLSVTMFTALLAMDHSIEHGLQFTGNEVGGVAARH